MRIIYIIFFTLIVGCLTSSAQVFKTGLIAGVNGSQVGGDGFSGYNKLGFIVGGFANTKISENWSAQFEIYYIGKGSRKNANPSKGQFDAFNLSLNYVEIPIVLRYHHQKFMFEIGLYYSRLLGFSVSDQFGSVPAELFSFKNYDFGGVLGLDYIITERFIANIRFKNSILPIKDFGQNTGLYNELFNRGWYNTEINFTVRYQFGK